jgi:hypothetical protein
LLRNFINVSANRLQKGSKIKRLGRIRECGEERYIDLKNQKKKGWERRRRGLVGKGFGNPLNELHRLKKSKGR